MSRSLGSNITTNAPAEERRFHELYKVTLRDGTIFRYCDLDLPIVHNVGDGAGSQTWNEGAGIRRGEIRASMDLQIDDTTITVPNIDVTIGAVTRNVAAWARVRKFHGAQVDIYIYDEKSATSGLHSTWRIQGVGKASLTEVEFVLESMLALLAIEIPRTVFQPECNNALYDAHCGVVAATFAVTSTVTAATIDSVTYGTLSPGTPPVAPSYTDGYFDLGRLEFTSGNLSGLKATIAQHVGSVVKLTSPLPEIPANGVTIKLLPGCAKTTAHCVGKYNNLTKFRGFPFMPMPDEVLG